MSNDVIYRPTGLLERYHITRQHLQLDSCVIVAGKHISASNERLSPETLYPAVVHAVHTHAALSARINIVDSEKGPGSSFGRRLTVNVEQTVRFLDEDAGDLRTILEAEFTSPIDASGDLPLWRIAVTSDNTVILAWHHAIGDGQSGLAVLRTILDGLNNKDSSSSSSSGTDYSAVKIPPELQLTPPIEELTDLSVSIKTFLAALSTLFIPHSWTNRDVWTGNKVSTSATAASRTNVRIISIPAPSAARLLASARTHKTTLTAIIYTLSVSVLSKLVSEQPGRRKYKRLSTAVPTSLRPLAQLPPTVMGELVSTYTSREPLLPAAGAADFPWARAAAFSAKLHKALPKTRETIGSLKFLFGHYEGYFTGKRGAKREVSMELSNVGAFKPDVDGEAEWRIGDTYFVQDDGIIGAALKTNAVGSPDGGVNICVTWGEESLNHAIAEAFVKDLQVAIEDLSNRV